MDDSFLTIYHFELNFKNPKIVGAVTNEYDQNQPVKKIYSLENTSNEFSE